jgi:hypothetical protein
MGAMDEIRHLVVLMLENQSFDRLLGYLDLGDRTQKLEGLSGTETNPVSPPTDMTPVPAPVALVSVRTSWRLVCLPEQREALSGNLSVGDLPQLGALREIL